MRTARASGWRRHASIASLRADHQAALRAAQQLVGAEAHDRRAGAHRAAHRGLLGQQLDVVGEHARADVVDDRHAEPAQRLDLDLLGEAERAEVRRVRAQDRRRCARPAPRRSRPAACGCVVPTSTRRAPACPTTSGMRKPPPISMSCPRETTTSRPGPASAAAASSTAAAQLLTASAACAAGDLAQQPLDVRVARAALAGGQVELEVRVALGRRRHRGAGARGQRSAAEVRVHDDAGRVEHAPQRGPAAARAPARRGPRRRCPRRGPPRAARASSARATDVASRSTDGSSRSRSRTRGGGGSGMARMLRARRVVVRAASCIRAALRHRGKGASRASAPCACVLDGARLRAPKRASSVTPSRAPSGQH